MIKLPVLSPNKTMVFSALNQRFGLKQPPLRLVLVVPFVLQISLAVGLTSYLTIRNGQKAIHNTIAQLHHEISDRINEQILTHLEKPHTINQILAAGIADEQISLTDMSTIEHFYWHLVDQHTVDFLQIGTPSGTSTLVERSEKGFIIARTREAANNSKRPSYRLDAQGKRAELFETNPFDVRTRPWYQAALQAGQPTWSEIFVGAASSKATIALSQPIYSKSGKLLAVQSGNFRLSDIHEFLKNIPVGQTGQTFIVDRGGNLIASSIVEKPYKIQNQELKLVSAADFDNPVISATAKGLVEQFGQFRGIDKHHQLEIQVNGDRHFVQVFPIRDERGIDWLSIVVIPESDFMAEINANTRTTLLLCLAALATTTLLGIYTSRWISRPILRLSQASEAIADGAFDQAVEPPNVRELRVLAHAFNQMAQHLRESFTALARTNEQLEERVEARTTELSNALQELQRTQSQMLQAEKMSSLGQLVAGVAHEINNPVNFIHGNVIHVSQYSQELLELIQLYQHELPAPTPAIQAKIEEIDLEFLTEDLLKLLNSMNVGTERIQEIVKSLRTFSRLDEAQVKAVDIHEGLDSTLMILQHRLKANQQHPEILVVRDYGDLPQVECYSGQLNQVFMNILVNAIDALEDSWVTRPLPLVTVNSPMTKDQGLMTQDKEQRTPPTITIGTSVVEAEWVQITIADNGQGMPEEIRQYIFNPFFTTKPVGKGTGMGMSISHQIITARHGGKLECFSRVGEGTEFVIQIPMQLNMPT